VTGFCEDGSEHSGSMKGGEFVYQLSEYSLKKISASQR
jgi:hypothetical protein